MSIAYYYSDKHFSSFWVNIIARTSLFAWFTLGASVPNYVLHYLEGRSTVSVHFPRRHTSSQYPLLWWCPDNVEHSGSLGWAHTSSWNWLCIDHTLVSLAKNITWLVAILSVSWLNNTVFTYTWNVVPTNIIAWVGITLDSLVHPLLRLLCYSFRQGPVP
jgi:hypothetical protein